MSPEPSVIQSTCPDIGYLTRVTVEYLRRMHSVYRYLSQAQTSKWAKWSPRWGHVRQSDDKSQGLSIYLSGVRAYEFRGGLAESNAELPL